MFGWFSQRRRRRLTEAPFPASWEDILRQNVAHFRLLNVEEQAHLRKLIQVFIAEKAWEGCGGLELTDEIRVTISAMACLLILNLPQTNYYANVETILVYPEDVALPERKLGFFETAMEPLEIDEPISGQAFEQGPVILVWDAVRQAIEEAGSGYNVVYHEFAHKLDMQDGMADGTPPLSGGACRDWMEICSREYRKLLKNVQKGRETFLDGYGATDEAEFFAVATEHFFDQPREMLAATPELYRVLTQFYGQDPARRIKSQAMRNHCMRTRSS